jgi:hypothetical protein
VRWWWWPSGGITPAISTLNEGKMMRGRGSGKGGVRFGEERGRRGRRPGVVDADGRARDGSGGLLEEEEGEGVGVGWASQEAVAQEEWGWLGRPG